jgi:hypothetical protein
MTIASNILAAVTSTPALRREVEAQCIGYLDETPYSETWYFIDRSAIEHDWVHNTFTETK